MLYMYTHIRNPVGKKMLKLVILIRNAASFFLAFLCCLILYPEFPIPVSKLGSEYYLDWQKQSQGNFPVQSTNKRMLLLLA